MNIQQIEYVIATGELKSFGLAAEKCFITQPTLSTMISKFEKEIGVLIFDRKTKPIKITKEGHLIIEQLKRIRQEITSLTEVVDTIKDEMKGTIRIGVIPTIAPTILPQFLSEFVGEYPEVQFEISEMFTEKIIELLESREIDIGIVSLPLNRQILREIPVYNEPFLVFDPVSTLTQEEIEVADIDIGKLWLLEEGHCMLTQVEKICALKSKKNNKVENLDYKSGSIDTLIKIVIKKRGLTLLPYLSTLDMHEKYNNTFVKIKSPIPARSVGLVVHAHFLKTNFLKAMSDNMKNAIGPLLLKDLGKYDIVNPY